MAAMGSVSVLELVASPARCDHIARTTAFWRAPHRGIPSRAAGNKHSQRVLAGLRRAPGLLKDSRRLVRAAEIRKAIAALSELLVAHDMGLFEPLAGR